MFCELMQDKVRSSIEFAGANTFLNLYSIRFVLNEPSDYVGFDHIYCDGVLLACLLGLFGIESSRVSFDYTSAADLVFKWCEHNRKTLCVIGSTEENIEKFCFHLRGSYPRLSLVRCFSGYHSNEDEIVSAVLKESPDVVICGMGAPKQDKFLMKLKVAGFKGVSYTCGGFIHQTAGSNGIYYPSFFNKNGLRWLYRCVNEPYVIRRYFVDYPINFIRVAKGFVFKR